MHGDAHAAGEVVFQLQIALGAADHGVARGGHIPHGEAVRVHFCGGKPRQQCGVVEGGADLAHAPAHAGNVLAPADDGRFGKARPCRALAHGGVEGKHPSCTDIGAVQLAGGEGDVVGAGGVFFAVTGGEGRQGRHLRARIFQGEGGHHRHHPPARLALPGGERLFHRRAQRLSVYEPAPPLRHIAHGLRRALDKFRPRGGRGAVQLVADAAQDALFSPQVQLLLQGVAAALPLRPRQHRGKVGADGELGRAEHIRPAPDPHGEGAPRQKLSLPAQQQPARAGHAHAGYVLPVDRAPLRQPRRPRPAGAKQKARGEREQAKFLYELFQHPHIPPSFGSMRAFV